MKMSQKKPSQLHNNRNTKNWLIYDITDRFLLKNSALYKGVIFDLGCGESPYKDFFLQYADKYIGVDWGESIHSTKENIIADLNNFIPVDSEVADSIVSISVLEHLHNPQQMLNEAFRILKNEGAIILQVPWQWWVHESPHDYFRYTPYCLRSMFKKAGFDDISVESQSGFFTMWLLKFNYFSSRLIRGPKLIRWLIKTCLIPFWYSGQLCAPLLDQLDRNWEAETIGYFVTAKKREQHTGKPERTSISPTSNPKP